MSEMSSNKHDHGRYRKQERLAEMGDAGQRSLGEAHAVVVGVGALGCAVADQLARAGVGGLTLIDRDVVEWSNLQRQSLYTEQDAREGLAKAEAARRRLKEVNSSVEIEGVVADVSPRNAERLLLRRGSSDRFVIVDGTDNFEVRYLLNDVAVKHGVALAYAGVVGTVGTSMLVRPGKTACLRCVGEKPEAGSVETCETAGVFGPAVAGIAAFQAAEVIRYLARGETGMSASVACLDVWRRSVRIIDATGLGPRRECVCCGQRRFEHLDSKRIGEDVALCGQDAVQVTAGEDRRLDLVELAGRWRGLGVVVCSTGLARLTFASEERAREISVFADGRAIVKGTTRPEVARAIYARYVGI
jgi:adenylyltransferase/sulfurtransferase